MTSPEGSTSTGTTEISAPTPGTAEGGQPLCYGIIAGPGYAVGVPSIGGSLEMLPGCTVTDTESEDKSNAGVQAGLLLAFNDQADSTQTIPGAPGRQNTAPPSDAGSGTVSAARPDDGIPHSDADNDPAGQTTSIQGKDTPSVRLEQGNTMTEAENANSAHVTIDANGNVSVDTNKPITNNQVKVWFDPNYKGTEDEVRAKLEQAKARLGGNLDIPSTLPAWITNKAVKPAPTPDVRPNPEPNKPEDEDDKPQPPSPSPPCPRPTPPKPDEPVTPPKPDEDNVTPPDDGKPKPNTPSATPEWVDKKMTQFLLNEPYKDKDGKLILDKNGNELHTPINPYTFKKFADKLMSNRVNHMPLGLASKIKSAQPRDLNGDGVIDESEVAAATKELEDYLASEEGKNDLQQLSDNVADLSNRLGNGPLADKDGAKAMTDFVAGLKDPVHNRELIGNVAALLQKGDAGTLNVNDVTGNKALLSSALQKAIVHLAIADIAPQKVTTTDGKQETLLDLKTPPPANSSEQYKRAYDARMEEVINRLQGDGTANTAHQF